MATKIIAPKMEANTIPTMAPVDKPVPVFSGTSAERPGQEGKPKSERPGVKDAHASCNASGEKQGISQVVLLKKPALQVFGQHRSSPAFTACVSTTTRNALERGNGEMT